MKAILNGAFGQIELGTTKLTIGRSATNQLVLNSSQISAYHAEIRPEGNEYSIIDLGSTNGTFLNDYRLPPHVTYPLHPNTRLQFGQDRTNPATLFTYALPGAAPLEPTYFAPSPQPVYSSSPQQGYQQSLSSSHSIYVPSQLAKKKPDDDREGKWSWRDWLVKVIIPVLGILGTAGFFTARAATPSIPQLHKTYSGHITTVSATGGLFLTGINETPDGNFAGTGTDSCALTIENGKVNADGSIFFDLKETPVPGTPCGVTGEYHGTVRPDGSMSGTWDVPNTAIQGSWDLS